jgi:plastocyanin
MESTIQTRKKAQLPGVWRYEAISMRARRPLAIAAALAGAASLAAPAALAADQSVVARIDNTFSPRLVAVRPGEKVTFTNQGGDHNVVWNDGGAPPQPPSAVPPDQWPAGGVSRTFTRPGRHRYYCEAHASPSGDFGMVGYVYVNAAGLLPPVVSGLTASGTRRGARIAFRASRAGTATATFLRRVGRRYVRRFAASFPARRGANSRRFARGLPMGAYRVEVVLTDANRLRSDKRTRAFAVR